MAFARAAFGHRPSVPVLVRERPGIHAIAVHAFRKVQSELERQEVARARAVRGGELVTASREMALGVHL